jgi:hypothetical protein
MPYVKAFKSGFEDLEDAKKFGLKIIHYKDLKPTDTVSLQYNWQLWGTKAQSIVCPGDTDLNDHSDDIFEAMVNYLNKNNIIEHRFLTSYESVVVAQEDVEIIKTPKSGIFIPKKGIGSQVIEDEVIGKVLHSLEGKVIHKILAPCSGVITCMYKNALILENAVAFRLAKNS